MHWWRKTHFFFFFQFCIFFLKLRLKKDYRLHFVVMLVESFSWSPDIQQKRSIQTCWNGADRESSNSYCLDFEQTPVVNTPISSRQNYTFECDSKHLMAFRIEVFSFKKLFLFYFPHQSMLKAFSFHLLPLQRLSLDPGAGKHPGRVCRWNPWLCKEASMK